MLSTSYFHTGINQCCGAQIHFLLKKGQLRMSTSYFHTGINKCFGAKYIFTKERIAAFINLLLSHRYRPVLRSPNIFFFIKERIAAFINLILSHRYKPVLRSPNIFFLLKKGQLRMSTSYFHTGINKCFGAKYIFTKERIAAFINLLLSHRYRPVLRSPNIFFLLKKGQLLYQPHTFTHV